MSGEFQKQNQDHHWHRRRMVLTPNTLLVLFFAQPHMQTRTVRVCPGPPLAAGLAFTQLAFTQLHTKTCTVPSHTLDTIGPSW